MTQGALGAALAAAAAPRGELRAAALAGLAAGMLADADILIRSAQDPLLTLHYHRHFSHALAFIPVGALLAAFLAWPFLRTRLEFARLYLYSLAGYSLSGLLDACTGYGTHLLWPFDDARVAWNLISVVDPMFTLALIVPLALALRSQRRVHARVGLTLAAVYMVFAAVQHHRVEDILRQAAAGRGHSVERALVRPTFGNQILWRGLYLSNGVVHAMAIHAGLGIRTYDGAKAPLVRPVPGSPEARFNVFADGWLIAHPQSPARTGDARYAMLPTALRPLWSLESAPNGDVTLTTDRAMSNPERKKFLQMLQGL